MESIFGGVLNQGMEPESVGRSCIFRRLVSKGLIEKMIFEQRFEGKKASQVDSWKMNLSEKTASAKALMLMEL